METKFTPGPWGVEFTERSVYVGQTRPAPRSGLDQIVLRLDHGDTLTDEANATASANAHLIAAAPEMLAALTLAEDVLSRFPYSSELWPNGTHPNTGIMQIRAALAKSRGEP